MRRYELLLLIPLIAAAPPLAADQPRTSPECGHLLPQVLNVGLPYREVVGSQGALDQSASAQALLGDFVEPIYADRPRCPGRRLQVNVALGSDYQIVDWLARGSIHMAVLSDLGIHVLQREGIPLLEVASPSGASVVPVVPELVALRVGSGPSESLPEPQVRLREHWQELLARAVADGSSNGGTEVRGRLVFRSHFSSVSFLTAVEATHEWLEERLPPGLDDDSAKRRVEIRNRFWDELFHHACFRLSPRPESGPSCGAPGATDGGVEIEYVEAASGQVKIPSVSLGPDRLVITEAAAMEIFAPGVIPERSSDTRTGSASDRDRGPLEPLNWKLPAHLRPLFGGTNGDLPREPVPAFESFLARNAFFGTRTFAFTADEAIRLLALNQRTSSRSQLALVLPGGGVKAAYQSLVIDDLYGRGMLVNYRNATDAEGGARPPLPVHYVVGTSGGALLGFFVARMGPHGPFDLSNLLWSPARPEATAAGGGQDGGRKRFLTSSQVFGVTDLPRYLSLVTILLVFCVALAICSLGPVGWLAPERAAERAPVPPKSWRPRLTLSILFALVGTPLLVKWVTVGRTLEHVPELEGLLFAVLTVVAMFADQCLVLGVEERSSQRSGRPLDWARWTGWALLLVPGLAALPVRWAERWPEAAEAAGLALPFDAVRLMLEASAATGWVYLALLLLVSVLLFLGVRTSGPLRWWEVAGWVLATALGTVAAGVLLTATSPELLSKLERIPLLFLALGLTLLLTVANRVGAAHPRLRAWRARLMPTGRLAWFTVLAVTSVVVCTALLDLARPGAEKAAEMSFSELIADASKLDVPHGGLAVIVGAVLLLFALVRRLHERHSRYRLEGTRDFGDAVLAVLVGLSLGVYVVLLVIAWFWPTRMTLFELTPSFWKGLVLVSLALTAAMLAWSRWGRPRTVSRRLTAILVFLCGRHPNAHLVSRRFARVLILAGGGLVAWNFVLAPGLYGNRIASDYITGVDSRFAAKFDALHPNGSGGSYLLSTRLLATANALEQDGTRFVLAVPEGERCLPIQQDPGSQWLTFEVVTTNGSERSSRDDDCPKLTIEGGIKAACSTTDGVWELDCLRRYVFASGSPFPVFPAHRVPQADGRLVALVDGGYSNNVPVEAASAVGVGQVLIVNSSNPLAKSPPGWWSKLRPLRGPLVENAPRLPGFLYQRAQQMDRLSRQNLFVVSLSPNPQPNWPILTDFRSKVVERMLNAAVADRGRRIGMVESWGPPSFQVSLQPEAAGSPSLRRRSGGRASSPGRPRPAPDPAR